MSFVLRHFWILLLAILVTHSATRIVAQDDEPEEAPEYLSGWIGTYSDDAGTVVRRVDGQMSFPWHQGRPDERLENGPFRVRWQGKLLTKIAGSYQIAAFSAGSVELRINDKVVLAADTTDAKWTMSEPIEFSFGRHDSELRLKSEPPQVELSLYWRGPGFDWEPLNPANLFHRTEASPPASFSAGKQLARALRCVACHQGQAALPAPQLKPGSGHVSREWVANHLIRSPDGAPRQHRRMPYFDMSPQDARDLATYLAEATDDTSDLPNNDKQTREGRELFLKRGCVACHRMETVGSIHWLDGGDLTQIGGKRSTDYLRQWLTNPAELQTHHRMPKFKWAAGELELIVGFLASTAPTRPKFEMGDAKRGASLYQEHGCVHCHAEKKPDSLPARPLGRNSAWDKACSGSPTVEANRKQPRYLLEATDCESLQDFFSQQRSAADDHSSAWQLGQQLFAEHRCAACHSRGGEPGLASKLRGVADRYPHLAPELPAVTPPSLNSVGDKLNVNALRKAIRRDGEAHRDWLTVQMPQFELPREYEDAIIAYLRGSDMFPPNGPQPKPAEAPENLGNVGARLVTTDGFGCTSCHRIGKFKPPKAPLNARGPDLAMLGERINRQWFERWVRNPARIVPRMEMPSIKAPVHGVLDENLPAQLAAVWETLNQPGFAPPAPNPIRTVRRSGTSATERAVTLTDVVRLGDQKLIKPLIVGLANRHNLLFDLETASLALWWTGDTARQRTEGKIWFWEVANPSLLAKVDRVADISLIQEGRRVSPILRGQFVTEFDSLRYEGDTIRFSYRLSFPPEVSAAPIIVVETLRPLWNESGESGWRRHVEVQKTPPGWAAELQVDSVAAGSGSRVAVGNVAVGNKATDAAQVSKEGWVPAQNQQWQVDYLTRQLVDKYATAEIPAHRAAVEKLPAIVPGFSAQTESLEGSIMPTGLAWLPDGRLVVCSLKGRVWLLTDSNNDGVFDKTEQFSDELAAPYGVAVGKDATGQLYIDVINKYALLRLYDRDQDGFAEEVQTVASGWGHTSDYHDWALGMPRSDSGGYYISIPCQQDDRSKAASLHRGTVAELVPRQSTTTDPNLYSISPISAGHRFAMGIARNKAGQLFVTDNQGNYNPYNELNHVRPGKRYGFINKSERSPDFRPERTEPAINIPHPWTRSVNGICFLETAAENAFGPFTGHLVGCEYDTRRLIRMSLEEVNGNIQGAAYPLSQYQPVDGKSFLGPLIVEISPDGDLYVGGIRDSGWGGANNIGALTRLRFEPDQLGIGIAEVRAIRDGFEIDWTGPVDTEKAGLLEQYQLESARRESTPSYGGDDIDRRVENVVRVEVVSPTRVRLHLAQLKPGFVYDIRVRNIAAGNQPFFPAEAFYSMQSVPE
jgi:cbb3-type cytochrome oxidase cytochrome c subunit/glucose/arabinose dehydrogenase